MQDCNINKCIDINSNDKNVLLESNVGYLGLVRTLSCLLCVNCMSFFHITSDHLKFITMSITYLFH